jgi:hypothetical protein
VSGYGDDVSVDGEIDSTLGRADLVALLCGAGLAAEDAFYALRVRLAGERVEFARDDRSYILCCGFESPECRAQLPEFSTALGKLELRHRFEVYADEELVAYHHFDWPQAQHDEHDDIGDA